MKKVSTLKINPLLKACHYEFYFGVSRRTAYRMIDADRILLNKQRLTFLDFYMLHEAFPAPNFTPNWVTMVYADFVPKVPKLPVCAIYG